MKLLITTQAVDAQDPVLGFFVRWIEEFARHCEEVTVICLRQGAHQLPSNVRVFELGGTNKLSRAYALLRGAIRFRANYDSVFVHMNPEYLVAAGWLWRLLGKRTVLWYTHKHVDTKLRIAVCVADKVLSASKESFRLATRKLRIVGHGIDTDFFTPGAEPRGKTVLSAGRLSKAKRHDLVIEAGQYLSESIWIAGEGPERASLEARARQLHVADRVQFLGARTQTELRELYRRCGVLAHVSETGSMDKVVLEALLCGLPVVSTSVAFQGLLEPYGCYATEEVKSLAASLDRANGMDVSALRDRVLREHSLAKLIPAIVSTF